MYVFVIFRNGKRTWQTFDTEEKRNIAYGKLFIEAQSTGCGPTCDHFTAGEGWFEHCLIGRVEKVPVLKLFEE